MRGASPKREKTLARLLAEIIQADDEFVDDDGRRRQFKAASLPLSWRALALSAPARFSPRVLREISLDRIPQPEVRLIERRRGPFPSDEIADTEPPPTLSLHRPLLSLSALSRSNPSLPRFQPLIPLSPTPTGAC